MLGGEGAKITIFFQERSLVMVVVTVLQILIH
jgi:hypothetical protein